jgi:hypothetical protein
MSGLVMDRVYFSQLGAHGDTKITWNPSDETEVAEARNTFELLKSQGYRFFIAKVGKGKGSEVTEFEVAHKALRAEATAVAAGKAPKASTRVTAVPRSNGGYPVEVESC